MSSLTNIKKYKRWSFIFISFGVISIATALYCELPFYTKNKSISNDIKALTEKINEQRELNNSYAKLESAEDKLQRLKKENDYLFSNSDNIKIFSDQDKNIMDISKAFEQIVKKNNLDMKKLIPDLNSVGQGKNVVNIKLVFTGNLTSFFKLLFFVEKEKRVVRINSINITQNMDSKEFNLDMNVKING